jgi:hypothetical protein
MTTAYIFLPDAFEISKMIVLVFPESLVLPEILKYCLRGIGIARWRICPGDDCDLKSLRNCLITFQYFLTGARYFSYQYQAYFSIINIRQFTIFRVYSISSNDSSSNSSSSNSSSSNSSSSNFFLSNDSSSNSSSSIFYNVELLQHRTPLCRSTSSNYFVKLLRRTTSFEVFTKRQIRKPHSPTYLLQAYFWG